MILLSKRRQFLCKPNVCLLVLMLTVLMVRESMSATGYIPSTFQEEKGDFPNKPRNGPFQRTDDQKILSKWNEYKGHGRSPPSKKSARQGEYIALWIIIPLIIVLFLLISSGFFINHILQPLSQYRTSDDSEALLGSTNTLNTMGGTENYYYQEYNSNQYTTLRNQ